MTLTPEQSDAEFDAAARRIGRQRAIKFFAVRAMIALLLIAIAVRMASGA